MVVDLVVRQGLTLSEVRVVGIALTRANYAAIPSASVLDFIHDSVSQIFKGWG
jgi:hypothetical protein